MHPSQSRRPSPASRGLGHHVHPHHHPGCPPHPHHPCPPLPSTDPRSISRILSRNVNGTIAMTSQPSNESELQLYRVLQRANLLSYFDTFICQGGDDVQQLCEAGEEEFLEIMALVGMASKPLHVRRLQKALQEWVQNPVAFLTQGLFQGPPPPMLPGPSGHAPPSISCPGPSGHSPAREGQTLALPPPPMPSSHHQQLMAERLAAAMSAAAAASAKSPPTSRARSPMNHSSGSLHDAGHGSRERTSTSSFLSTSGSTNNGRRMSSPVNGSSGNNRQSPSTPSPTNGHHHHHPSFSTTREGLITNEYGQPASPISLTPILMDNQIQRLADAAESLVKALPPMDPLRLANNKKRISKELEIVLNMADDDPRRLDEIRKYAAIYGRFDCKRKPEKPLTLHEVSVNEAAAQICRHIPTLLTRRDELFPMARQVVRDSGYQYSKGHSRSQFGGVKRSFDENSGMSGSSERKYFNSSDRGSDGDRKGDTDDTDSQYSLYSNPNSESNDVTSQNEQSMDGVDDHRAKSDVLKDQDGQEGSTSDPTNILREFPKLLPAKKSGNFGSASQLAKQLVQETLLDEGLRVVKEFNGPVDHQSPSKESPNEKQSNGQQQPTLLDLTRGVSTSPNETPIKDMIVTSTPLTLRESLMTPPSIPFHPMPPRRGRPPKNPQLFYQNHVPSHVHHAFPGMEAPTNGSSNRDLRFSLEAAYQQHLQQTLFAQQMMAAASSSGFGGHHLTVPKGSRMAENGLSSSSSVSSTSSDSSPLKKPPHIMDDSAMTGDERKDVDSGGISESPLISGHQTVDTQSVD